MLLNIIVAGTDITVFVTRITLPENYKERSEKNPRQKKSRS